MDLFRKTSVFIFLCFIIICLCVGLCESDNGDTNQAEGVDKAVEYAKGSVCGYCSYCKFCKLCDKDCPCETSPSKPNCKMCKYCKYCYLCSGVCNTICQPGGMVDKVSAKIVNALPWHNKDEIEGDIKSVKTWIDRVKDEL